MLPGQVRRLGVTVSDNPSFIDAMTWVACTGTSWGDLAEAFGSGNSVS